MRQEKLEYLQKNMKAGLIPQRMQLWIWLREALCPKGPAMEEEAAGGICRAESLKMCV